MSKLAARKLDLTIHAPVINSGSPDTTVGGQPAARLADVTLPCPLCKTPGGKIVTSSATVFINRQGAARMSDKVSCGPAGAGPGGCSHPPAKGYQPRDDDHYENLIAGEHEVSEFDSVDTVSEAAPRTPGESATKPVGLAPSGGRDAARNDDETTGDQGDDGKPYHTAEHPNPFGRQVQRGESESVSSLQGGDVRPEVERELGEYDHVLGLGEKSVAAKFGTGKDGSSSGKKIAVEKDEDQRITISINLGFSLEFSFGQRSGKAGYGGAANAVTIGCPTVFIGD